MVYGDMLGYFSELLRTYENFEMNPKVVSGYSERFSIKKVTGVFQEIKAGQLNTESETWAATNVPVFFTRDTLRHGSFLDVDGVVYRVNKTADWKFEGGFTCYTIQTLTGNNGTQTSNEGLLDVAGQFQ